MEQYADRISLFLVDFDIYDFRRADISEEKLEELRIMLETVKEHHAKVIFRAAYGFEIRDRNDADSLIRIGHHIEQIAPLLNEYKAQIFCVQAGWFGPWGEWHSSAYTDDELDDDGAKNRVWLVKELLGVLDEEIPLCLRRPDFIKEAEPVVFALPDRTHLYVTEDIFEQSIEEIPNALEENYDAYYTSIEGAWPFHILDPEMNNDKLTLNWEEAYRTSGDVHYVVEVDNGWDFEEPLVYEENVTASSLTIDSPPTGAYFLRVTAYSPSGTRTPAIENYYTEKKTTVYGVLYFYVTSDGKAVASYVENQE